ncbi:SDR family NAD(P)-dependent oxidoreductase [Mycolicibacterium vaccae]|uniref:SDR family NAD(P)-dependent oxidoreductase n=1 Tax=Mycolicibacterium vaccae TaxID=1810 RepID=UPI003D04C02F
MSRLLEGRAVVITGAGRGLGEAYAKAVADQGAHVVVNDIDAAGAERVAASLPSAVPDTSDISTWVGAQSVINRCTETFGRIDGLVNNAGIVRVSPPAEASPEDLRAVVDVNLLGTAYCGVLAMRAMIARGGGAIVNVTSGAQLGMAAVAGYAATKGAITALTYSWAAAYGETGVRVNAVSPDAVTPLAQTLASEFPEVQAGAHSPESNAPAVVYLLSDLAQEVNGRVIMTGGTRLALMHPPRIGKSIKTADPWTPAAVAELFRDTKTAAHDGI